MLIFPEKMRLILFFCLSLTLSPISGQDLAFPEAWRGTWSGELRVFQGRQNVQNIPMTLTIQPTVDDRYTWHIQYGTDTADLRKYQLVPVEPDVGYYAIDEQNGIVLDAYLQGDTFYSSFSVSGNKLLTRVRKRDNTLEYEITAGPLASTGETGGLSAEILPVQLFQIRTLQRAMLRKEEW